MNFKSIKSGLIVNVLEKLIPLILSALSPEDFKTAIDKALDWIEERAASSETKLDDAVVFPLTGMIRTALDIPDNDEPAQG